MDHAVTARGRVRVVVGVVVASLALGACAVAAQDDPELIPAEEVPFDLSVPSTSTSTSTSTTTTTSVPVVPTVGG